MKKVITIVALALTTISTSAQKLGHINSQEMMVEMKEYKAAEAELERYQGELMRELEMFATLIKQDEAKYIEDEPNLTEEIKASRYQELMQKSQNFQAKQGEAEKKLQDKEAMLMQTVLKKIQEAVQKVAKENSYTYVFDTSSLHYAGGEDVTPLLKKELGIITE
jgi:outer membrane protein